MNKSLLIPDLLQDNLVIAMIGFVDFNPASLTKKILLSVFVNKLVFMPFSKGTLQYTVKNEFQNIFLHFLDPSEFL